MARSVLMQPLTSGKDALLVLSTAPRGFDAKARALVAALCAKLSDVL
jgi:hypothetical protein